MAYIPRTEFAQALKQIALERGIDAEAILETIKTAMIAAYRRDARERGVIVPEEENLEAEINSQTGEVKIFCKEKGQKRDVTPPGFGRIAAQTAKQVILQKIREAEKDAVLAAYAQRVGSLVSGLILRFDGPNIVVEIGKTEAIMPPEEQVKTDGYKINQRLTFFIKELREGPRGQQIIVSRADNRLVEGLFRREVPEVSSGAVEIVAIAREPGVRTKMAVCSKQTGVDPVGSCVGQKGVRVQEVIEELGGEKIDIIPYSRDEEKFITAALAPIEGIKVEIDKQRKTARVIVPDDQLSLVIGGRGQNARLASKLTDFKIDILGESEIGEEKRARTRLKKSSAARELKTKKGEKKVVGGKG